MEVSDRVLDVYVLSFLENKTFRPSSIPSENLSTP